MIPETITNAQLRHIFVEIHNGRNYHGSFLQSFALAVLNADQLNFHLLRPSMESLVRKYDLEKYLDTYREEDQWPL